MKKPEINKRQELPEILYEAPSYPGEPTSGIPYISSDKDNPMPSSLFIFEYFETGEFEPDERGKSAQIVDQVPHHFIDMEVIKSVLSPADFDKVRVKLGMKPLKQAQKEGKVVLDKIMSKQEELKKQALETQDERIEAHKEAMNQAKERDTKLEN